MKKFLVVLMSLTLLCGIASADNGQSRNYTAPVSGPNLNLLRLQIQEMKNQGLYDADLWNEFYSSTSADLRTTSSLDEGGEDCSNPTVITTLPFDGTGNTSNFQNDYDFPCPYTGSTSPDVIYLFSPNEDMCVDIDLDHPETLYDTKLYVYEDVCGDITAIHGCNDDISGVNYSSQLLGLQMTGGHNYYIVVDGYAGDYGQYRMTISPCAIPCVCGPMDLVFVIDTTGSMSGAISSVANELPNIIATANFYSCDVQLGLVTFGDQVVVNHQLTIDQMAVEASIAALTAVGGDGDPECSDEAILEVVNGTGTCVVNDWTSAFRPDAVKIIVLVTDAEPAGCDDDYVQGVDDVHAHNVALAAQAASIRIAAVYVPTWGYPDVISIMQDYAATTSGSYRQTASNGDGTGAAINEIVADCGQGILQMSAPVPPLECINAQITPNPAGFDITVENAGNLECIGVELMIGLGSGPGGTGTIVPDYTMIGTLPAGGSVVIPATASLVTEAAGGLICFRADITSADCPPAFLDICFDVPPCEGCDAPEVAVVDVSDGIPTCACVDACQGPQTVVFAPLTIDQRPLSVRFDEGCDGEPFRGDPLILPGYSCEETDCPPAYPDPVSDFYYSADLGGWCIDVVVASDGCYCVCIDDILPVELVGFEAIPADGEITLSWTTASEVNNDRFEIMRDATLMGVVDAHNSATGHAYSWTESNLTNGREYSYSLIAVSMDGIRETIGTVSATPSANAATVTEYALHQNYPNPFNPETSISFDLAEAGMVKLTVFNPLGQTVATLVNGSMASGRHTIAFDGTNLTSGLYYYRMEAGDFTAVRKMILMK